MEVPSLGSASQAAIEGLKRAQEKTQQAAQNIAEGPLNPEDIISLSLAAQDFKANVAVLKAQDETTKALLDIVA
jgi:hypothetical protein